MGGEQYHALRKSQFQLDISPLQGKVVRQIHWDDRTLILEFERATFLQISTFVEPQNGCHYNVRIVNSHSVKTDREAVTKWGYEHGIYDDKYQEIANIYIGKTFTNVYCGPQNVFLYFLHMPLLILCTVVQVVESEKFVLSWGESD